MKYLLMVFVVICFGCIGYAIKKKIINQKILVDEIKSYLIFYQNNLLVFQTNLCDINNRYIIMQNNKSANKYNFILKNSNLYQYNTEFIKNQLNNIIESEIIVSYFNSIGKYDYDTEKNKTSEIIKVVGSISDKLSKEIDTKGGLWFKILLSLGIVIAILIW